MKDLHSLLLIVLLAGCFFTTLTLFNKAIDKHAKQRKSKQWQLWKEKHIPHSAH